MKSKKPSSKTPVGARLRIVLDEEAFIGPGKVDLLDQIVATGSIAAAGRHMSMSYRRAWLLVDEMNHMFKTPLVTTAKGGKGGGGGAVLTDFGREVLTRYRNMQIVTAEAIAEDLKALHGALAAKQRPLKSAIKRRA